MVFGYEVHKKAPSQDKSNLEVVLEDDLALAPLDNPLIERLTKKQMHWPVRPPSKQDQDRHPEECKLDAKVNGSSVRH